MKKFKQENLFKFKEFTEDCRLISSFQLTLTNPELRITKIAELIKLFYENMCYHAFVYFHLVIITLASTLIKSFVMTEYLESQKKLKF